MTFKCKPGESSPCTVVQDVSSKNGRVRKTHLLTNGWTFDGNFFKKEGEKSTRIFNEHDMSEPEEEEESEDDLSHIGPPPDEPNRPSLKGRIKKKHSPNKRSGSAVAPAPDPDPVSTPPPAPLTPAPAPAAAPPPAPTPTPASTPTLVPATSDECSEYEEKIFYRHTVDGIDKSNLFSKMNIADNTLAYETANKSIKLKRDWFMDYVQDLIPPEGIYVVLENGFFVCSDENGNIITRSMFAKDFRKGKYNFKYIKIDFINFIISFLKKHIIVVSSHRIIHLNFQQYSYGDGYVKAFYQKNEFNFATVKPFWANGGIYEMYTLMNEETTKVPEQGKYNSLLEQVKLLEKWYPNLEITANIDNKKYILKTEGNVIKKKIKSTSVLRGLNKFATISEQEFLTKPITLDETVMAHLLKLEELKKLARCRLTYYENKQRKLPIELEFGIDKNTHASFVPFSQHKKSQDHINVYIFESNEKRRYGNSHGVPDEIRVLNDSDSNPSSTLIEKLVEDYLKKNAPAKVGGKSRNRRLKSRRMLKKSDYKKTRKYNRKIIK